MQSINEIRADLAGSRFDAFSHAIGLQRFLLGSDYVLGLDLKAYYANEKSALGASEGHWRTLASNLAPYIQTKPAHHCAVAR